MRSVGRGYCALEYLIYPEREAPVIKIDLKKSVKNKNKCVITDHIITTATWELHLKLVILIPDVEIRSFSVSFHIR